MSKKGMKSNDDLLIDGETGAVWYVNPKGGTSQNPDVKGPNTSDSTSIVRPKTSHIDKSDGSKPGGTLLASRSKSQAEANSKGAKRGFRRTVSVFGGGFIAYEVLERIVDYVADKVAELLNEAGVEVDKEDVLQMADELCDHVVGLVQEGHKCKNANSIMKSTEATGVSEACAVRSGNDLRVSDVIEAKLKIEKFERALGVSGEILGGKPRGRQILESFNDVSIQDYKILELGKSLYVS